MDGPLAIVTNRQVVVRYETEDYLLIMYHREEGWERMIESLRDNSTTRRTVHVQLGHGTHCVPECVCRNTERIQAEGDRRGETIRFVVRYRGQAPGDDFVSGLYVGTETDPVDGGVRRAPSPPPPTYEEASKTSPPQLMATAAAMRHSDGNFPPPPEYDNAVAGISRLECEDEVDSNHTNISVRRRLNQVQVV